MATGGASAVVVRDHPHAVAAALLGEGGKCLHQLAADASSARRLVDSELVEKRLGALVRVRRLDTGDEARWPIAGVVGEEQMVGRLRQEPLRCLGIGRIVEEPGRGEDGLFVAGTQTGITTSTAIPTPSG